MKKIALLIPLVLLAVACNRHTAKTDEQVTSSRATAALNSADEQTVKAAAFAAVDKATTGLWERKIEISKVDSSKNAVEGKWVAKDYWDWLAWKQDSQWHVLVSLDGFDCNELKTIQSQYNDFFKDIVYQANGKLYCYEHKNTAFKNFSVTLPASLVAFTQNDTPTLFSEIIFNPNKLSILQTDNNFGTNPLLAVLDKNVSYLQLQKTHPNHAIGLKEFLTLGAGGPNGKVYNVTLDSFNDLGISNGIDKYAYVTEIKAKPAIKRRGYIWNSKDGQSIYTLEVNDNDNSFSTDELLKIVTSFKEY